MPGYFDVAFEFHGHKNSTWVTVPVARGQVWKPHLTLKKPRAQGWFCAHFMEVLNELTGSFTDGQQSVASHGKNSPVTIRVNAPASE
jgi:hypothetical protein